MPRKCQLCGQPLPETLSPAKVQLRLQQLTSAALAAEKKKIKEEYGARLIADRELARQRAERQVAQELHSAEARADRAEREKKRDLARLEREHSHRIAREGEAARREARKEVRNQLQEAEERVKDAEARRRREVERVQKESDARLKKEVEHRVRLAAREDVDKLEKIQAEREKDKLRHAAEMARVQGKLDEASRKLDKLSGEQLGAEAELDLLMELRRAFCPSDKIDPIGRGVKGADIVHEVVSGGKIVGRIVYESKNTDGWSNGFIAQAKKYQTQYETPHIMVVTRTFPSKRKGFCIEKGVPIIESRAAVALATIIREGIIEIARLGLSGKSRDEKSQELFGYMLGDKFRTRFREIADGVSSLRDQQKKERTWHENQWETETKIHERIEGRHREVEAQIRAIASRGSNGSSAKLGVKSEDWPEDPSSSRDDGQALSRAAGR